MSGEGKFPDDFLIRVDGAGVVFYAGEPIGQIMELDRTWDDGRRHYWGNGDGRWYLLKKHAAYYLAQAHVRGAKAVGKR